MKIKIVFDVRLVA